MDTFFKTKNQKTLDGYLTVQQAQRLLQCSKSTIYGLFKSGEIHKYKLMSGSRINVRELQDYMERQKQLK